MQFRQRHALLLICCCLFVLRLPAQQFFQTLSISRLTPDDGLSQGSNYFRYEDSRGFMWLTANDAVNRFDGKTVKVYNLDKYFNNCPALQQGYGFAEDDESNIYIGSIRGLYVYHRRQDKFTLQPVFTNNTDSLAIPFACRDGKVWCFNRYYQLAVYDVQTKKASITASPALDTITSVHIYNLLDKQFYYRLPFFDDKGTVWVVGNSNIAAYDTRAQQVRYPFGMYIKKRKPVFYCAACRDGKLICGTMNGAAVLNLSTMNVDEVTALDGKKTGSVTGVSISSSMVAIRCSAGIVFFAADRQNVQWFEPGADERYRKTYHFSFDKAGRLWMCDDSQGLVIFDFNSRRLGKEPSDAYPDRFNLGAGISIFTELPDGNMLIMNNVVQDKNTGQLSSLTLSFEKELAGRAYRCYADKFRKGIWFFEEQRTPGSLKRQLFFYSPVCQKKIMVLPQNTEPPGTLKDMLVLADGQILCSFEEGLFWLCPETASMKKVTGAGKRLPFTINALSGGRIAVSYLSSEMLLYQLLPDNSMRLLTTILPGVQSFYLQQDTVKNRYWAGTNAGVFLLDSAWNTIRRFDANNGLAGTYIYGLLLDDSGNAWCSHQRGISSISSQYYQVVNYDRNDGIQDWDFNNRAFLKASDGALFFGGAKGFNYIRPQPAPKLHYRPEVYVDEILVNGSAYKLGANADYIEEVFLEYGLSNVAVKAAVKDLVHGNMRQLIYRLAGADTAWKLLPNGSTINFSQLAPGAYTLQLGWCDKYDTGKKIQKSIRIIVDFPFYRKPWFWALIAVLATSAVFRYGNMRKMARQKVKFQQEMALEKQRQRLSADLHDDIGASLSSLQLNSAVAETLLRTDKDATQAMLNRLQEQVHQLGDKLSDIVWSMKPGKDEFMTLSTRVKNFACEILGAVQIRPVITVAPEIDSLLTDAEARKNLVFIIKEAVNNAAKYSRASVVTVNIDYSNGTVSLRVADDGIGFEPGQKKGNGIGNMQRRAAELGGVLSVKSAPGKGTVVTAVIRLVT